MQKTTEQPRLAQIREQVAAEPGGSTGAVACVVGNRTYMRHEWGLKGCKVCGMPFPVIKPL